MFPLLLQTDVMMIILLYVDFAFFSRLSADTVLLFNIQLFQLRYASKQLILSFFQHFFFSVHFKMWGSRLLLRNCITNGQQKKFV